MSILKVRRRIKISGTKWISAPNRPKPLPRALSQQSVSRCLTEVCKVKVFILAIHQ